MTDDDILARVALGYSAFIDRSRSVTATRLTVFALRPDAALDAAVRAARRDAPRLGRALREAGWQVSPFLLSPREKGGYVLLG